jgi:hypothetical protein
MSLPTGDGLASNRRRQVSHSRLQLRVSWFSTQSQSFVTTDGQSASLSSCQAPIWGPRRDFLLLSDSCGCVDVGRPLGEKMGLSFTIAAGPRQRSHSRVRVSRDSWPHFTASDSRFPQPGGPGPRIYMPQEEGGPVIPPGTGFPFRSLVRISGLGWRYSNPLPRGIYKAAELLYDWRFAANQFILATNPLRLTTSIFFSTEHLRLKSLCNIISERR